MKPRRTPLTSILSLKNSEAFPYRPERTALVIMPWWWGGTLTDNCFGQEYSSACASMIVNRAMEYIILPIFVPLVRVAEGFGGGINQYIVKILREHVTKRDLSSELKGEMEAYVRECIDEGFGRLLSSGHFKEVVRARI